MRELGGLYMHTSPSQMRVSDASNQDRSAAFRRRLLWAAAFGRLFAIADILVERQVRT
ncbi:hypothetical protein [Streptomyces chartreusis]|uniref:hypothetical protein n=1 Tax=Streptomyces chartreusis TaxID=1969 RepID=UPI002E19C4FF